MKPLAFLNLTSIILLATACASDNEIKTQRKELRTDDNTYDVGIVAVGERETIPVVLESVGVGGVTITSITSSDPDHFVILPSWANTDTDGDGIADALKMQRGTDSNPTQAVVEINFRPDSADLFRTQLTIISDDNTTTERTEEDEAILRTVVRGVGQVPCATVFPQTLDFGKKPPGGYFAKTLTIQNCGDAPITLSSFQIAGNSSFYGASATPIYIFAGESEVAEVAWIPGTNNAENADLTMVINDPNFPNPISLKGNSCTDSKHEDWDVDGDGWRSCLGDCDDNNPDIHPGAIEIINNKDDNCNGEKDEEIDSSVDNDLDGLSILEGDCNDFDADVVPEATEIWNGIDDNCDGIIDNNTEVYDDDGDGLSEIEGDCDDDNPNIHPELEEIQNDFDDNCNGLIDEGFDNADDDGDGYTEQDGDCDDADPWSWPTAFEDCDGVDNDCDGKIDEGEDDGEGAACAFVAEREFVVPEDTGCSSASIQNGIWFSTLFSILLMFRRKEQ